MIAYKNITRVILDSPGPFQGCPASRRSECPASIIHSLHTQIYHTLIINIHQSFHLKHTEPCCRIDLLVGISVSISGLSRCSENALLRSHNEPYQRWDSSRSIDDSYTETDFSHQAVTKGQHSCPSKQLSKEPSKQLSNKSQTNWSRGKC